jgi:uncharacterized membrane protein YkgB
LPYGGSGEGRSREEITIHDNRKALISRFGTGGQPLFLTTLSFLVTTPGVWESTAGGFPALSVIPGQFLIKDLALLGISLWTLGEAWKASER